MPEAAEQTTLQGENQLRGDGVGDWLAADLRAAQDARGEITGANRADDLLAINPAVFALVTYTMASGSDHRKVHQHPTGLIVALVLLLSGCAAIQPPATPGPSSEPTGRSAGTDETTISLQAERDALFNQPYIDPLTDYLHTHEGDSARAPLITDVRQERTRRCEAVARKYAHKPLTEASLESYRAGYQYSCPQEVHAFAQRVQERRAKAQQNRNDSKLAPSELSNCYLLTSIRNFTEAKEACLEPAAQGDVRAQANLAIISRAFEQYPEAVAWAKKAAPESADACFVLGRLYESGLGVEADTALAAHWYQKAVELGDPDARAALQNLSSKTAQAEN
ncbi:Sel1 domain-containing protein repeat-containing protein [Marinobacter santoriniensis NKSG1]|uniref:Sel1 domain-containing protein repeat-containing protein n=1 Tax=Marinobacter santoriniensis NKSG1 TaxID=1288826 RepID=M7CMZ5_9GAMM|nr:tetratricopeptide repeat protein [Marinobacter santoriniensis]EMP54544.1 Sel1 domain-containing protein repeat-containing protein [Marinobacter santoriniensis NKSG1]